MLPVLTAGPVTSMFNMAIDSKLHGCDVVALKVEDVAPNGYTIERATVRQSKTRRPVKFELSEQTRQAVEDYLRASGKKLGEFLFSGRQQGDHCMTTPVLPPRGRMNWQHRARCEVVRYAFIETDKATLIYRRTANLRAVQPLGHEKIESTVRYFGLEVDDALAVAEQVDV